MAGEAISPAFLAFAIKPISKPTPAAAAANAITGMEEPEEPDGASAQLERIIDKLAKGEESSKLDEIMDELNDPDKKITFH